MISSGPNGHWKSSIGHVLLSFIVDTRYPRCTTRTMRLHRVIKSIPYRGICGRKLRYRMNATTWRRLSFYRDSLFIGAYSSPCRILSFFVALIFLCLISHILNVHTEEGTENLYITQYRFSHLPKSLSCKFLRCALCPSRNHAPSCRVQLIAVTFSGHIFYLKGIPVNCDLGAV